jgi:lipopolysaccharide transport system permease protein
MRWDWEIKPETSWLDINWKEMWAYRHLLLRLIRRDFLTLYQQTLLGPVWVVIQPLLTVITYVLVFDRVFQIPINNVPPFLFYLCGVIIWNLFAETFNSTAFTFTTNAALFSKVYFPRLVIPFSITASHIIRFFIQFLLFAVFYIYSLINGDIVFAPLNMVIAFAFVITTVALLGLGFGLCFAVFIAKYRDVGNLFQLGLRLLFFATPIVYPLSFVENPAIRELMVYNPLAPLVEFFRHSFLGYGMADPALLVYSAGWAVIIFLAGTILFNRMGAKLIDVV